MKRHLHLLLPVFALLFQAVPVLFIRLLPRLVYAPGHSLSPASARPISLLALACFAAVSLALGGAGAYALLTRSRRAVALPLIAFCCFPALAGGAACLHALLVFLALV